MWTDTNMEQVERRWGGKCCLHFFT